MTNITSPQIENNQTPKEQSLSTESIAMLIESLLFVSESPVGLSDLANTLEVSTREIESALTELTEKHYANRYLKLQRLGNRVQLVTTPDAAEYIERFLGLSISGKLSPASLEALGIIAYKQPITRPEIEAIRGVSSDGVLRNLLGKGLIEEVGRLETVGHPRLYGTTFEFLKYFGLSTLSDMPALAMDENENQLSVEEDWDNLES